MAERDQFLAEFQAITGNENIDECIVILEQHDWNLMEAVQNTLAGTDPDPLPVRMSSDHQFSSVGFQTSGFQPFPEPMHASVPFNAGIIGESIRSLHSQRGAFMDIPPSEPPAAAASSSAFQPPSSFTSRSVDAQHLRLLTFNIEYRDRNIPLNVFDNETVGKIKQILEAETGVPVSKQELCGWVNKNDKRVMDEDRLSELKLPRENTLFLLTPEVSMPTVSKQNNEEDPNLFDRLSQTFSLKIHFRDKDQTYTVNFPGSKTIQEVKGDVYALIDVPVSKQLWHGWPDSVDDDTMTLAGSGIGFPCHCLDVRSAKPKRPTRRPEDMDLDSEDDFEDAQDHFPLEDNFLDPEIPGPRKPEPLMPENASDECEALECFSNEFASRFGECHPVFFIGKLEDALKHALQCPARDRKLLAIYLHHDSSILSNVFCSQVLCAESVVSFLSNNFIIWAWDLTSEANKARLLTMCSRHFGNLAATTVRNIRPDELPLLLIISRTRGTNEVVNAIRGNTTLEELMAHFIHTTEDFREHLKGEIAEEDERHARETVKRDQDEAYQESLIADRAKDQARRLDDDEKKQRETEETNRQKRLEQDKLNEERSKEAVRLSVANTLPEAPPANCSDPVTTIRIRCPDGRNLVRRFLAQNALQVLLNYITSEGFHTSDYKVLATFPRRDLTQMDTTATLEKMNLYPQETVILEEKIG